jgi:hypothetical protein
MRENGYRPSLEIRKLSKLSQKVYNTVGSVSLVSALLTLSNYFPSQLLLLLLLLFLSGVETTEKNSWAPSTIMKNRERKKISRSQWRRLDDCS